MEIGPEKEQIDSRNDDPEFKELIANIVETSRYRNTELQIDLFNEICAKGPSAWLSESEKDVLAKNFCGFVNPDQYEELAVCCYMALSRAREMKELLESRLGVRVRMPALFEAANPEVVYLEFEVADLYISVAVNTLAFLKEPEANYYTVTDFSGPEKFPDPVTPKIEVDNPWEVIAFLEEYLPLIAPAATPWPKSPYQEYEDEYGESEEEE